MTESDFALQRKFYLLCFQKYICRENRDHSAGLRLLQGDRFFTQLHRLSLLQLISTDCFCCLLEKLLHFLFRFTACLSILPNISWLTLSKLFVGSVCWAYPSLLYLSRADKLPLSLWTLSQTADADVSSCHYFILFLKLHFPLRFSSAHTTEPL